MKRPTKDLEQLRKALIPGAIDPERIYEFDLGSGQVMHQTGAELLDFASAFLDFADCEKKGDQEGMLRALTKLEGLAANDF